MSLKFKISCLLACVIFVLMVGTNLARSKADIELLTAEKILTSCDISNPCKAHLRDGKKVPMYAESKNNTIFINVNGKNYNESIFFRKIYHSKGSDSIDFVDMN